MVAVKRYVIQLGCTIFILFIVIKVLYQSVGLYDRLFLYDSSLEKGHLSLNSFHPSILADFSGISTPGIASKFANQYDFSSPWMIEQSSAIGIGPLKNHRKQWEIVYIAYIVQTYELCAENKHGMVWAAGKERLVSYFAKKGCRITASDLDIKEAVQKGWVSTNQYSAMKSQLWYPEIVDKQTFEKNVDYRSENMNFVPADLTVKPMFDFVWSTCSVEHVGSIALGMRFIINAMETVKPGGMAIHTMEFTLSSLDQTIEEGNIVFWRKKDVLRLERDLIRLGYVVFPIQWEAGELEFDKTPDVKPYRKYNHIKLMMAGHIVTSFCIIVRKPLEFKH